MIAFFYLAESPSEARGPDARQSASKVSEDYFRLYEAIGESNSQDFDVPIPPGRLGHGG
jgi:hypothetical protein